MDHLVPASDLPVAAKQLLLSGRPLRDEGFDAVEKLLGRHYRGPVETPAPDEFASEAWWICTEALKMAKGALNHLALTVRDLASSEVAFYAPVLGFLGYEKVEDIPEKMTLWFNGPAQIAVNLWQAEPELSARPHARYAPGFHHCAFAADSRGEVDALHDLLLARRIRVLDAPAEYPQYAPGFYAVYFEDFDGMKFEVVHMPDFPA